MDALPVGHEMLYPQTIQDTNAYAFFKRALRWEDIWAIPRVRGNGLCVVTTTEHRDSIAQLLGEPLAEGADTRN